MKTIISATLIGIFLSTGIGTLTSCKQNKEVAIEEKQLDFKTIETEAVIGSPVNLIEIGDTLLVNHYGGNEFLVWLSKKDGSVVKADIHKGNGPREMQGPLEVDAIGDSLMILDRPSFKVYNSDYMCDTLYTQTESLPFWVSQLYPLPTGGYLAGKFLMSGENPEVANTRFAIIKDDGTVVNFGSYPTFSNSDKDVPADGKAFFHQTFGFCPLPDNRFAVTSSHTISIYTLDNDSYRLEKEVQVAPYEYTYTPGTSTMSASAWIDKGYDTGMGPGIAYHDGKLYMPYYEGKSEDFVILCYDTDLNPVSKIVPSTQIFAPFIIDNAGYILAIAENENSFIAVSSIPVQDL